MLIEDGMSPDAAALAEARAFLRVDGSGEDALIGGLIGAACALCEAFVGQMIVARGVTETVAVGSAWTRLGRTPVLSVTGMVELGADGIASAVPVDAHGVDIDVDGDGWVRRSGSYRAIGDAKPELRVTYRAGLASEWAAAPVALRQGIVRLVAHLYAHRDVRGDAGGEPPAAVAALWRPYRRMPFGRARDGRR